MVSNELNFLVSALTEYNPFISSRAVMDWLAERQRSHRFEITQIPFRNLVKWRFNPKTRDLEHESGKFFSITGIWVETNFGPTRCWTQPIILQPEIGILGFLTKKITGIL